MLMQVDEFKLTEDSPQPARPSKAAEMAPLNSPTPELDSKSRREKSSTALQSNKRLSNVQDEPEAGPSNFAVLESAERKSCALGGDAADNGEHLPSLQEWFRRVCGTRT